ncbi:MAG: MFS transporter, partial [Gammaproteobacteria bacterium]|nr:MFS transporter [Gammaproteobacteria bacterium]
MSEVNRRGPWAPLAIRVYRYVWIAALVSNVGSFMHIAAASWQMTLLTDSPTLIGLVQTAWAVP